MQQLTKLTAVLLAFIMLFGPVAEASVRVQAIDAPSTEQQEIEDFLESIDEIFAELTDEPMEYDGETEEIVSALSMLADALGTEIYDPEAELTQNADDDGAEGVIGAAKATEAKVGSKKLKNFTYTWSSGSVTCDFLQIFKALGGKVKLNKKIGAVLYELNGIRKVYELKNNPKDNRVRVSYVANMFNVSKYFKIKRDSGGKKRLIHYERVAKIPKIKPTFAKSTQEFLIGMGNSFIEIAQSGLWVWLIKATTGMKADKPLPPAKLQNPKAYYLGRVVGDALAFAIGAKVAFDGIVLMIGSIVAGGAGTVMSGGTLVIAGVAVSVKGVVLGGAMTAAGGAIASRAVFAMGDDFEKVRYFSNANWSNGIGVTVKYHGKNVSVYRGGKNFTVKASDIKFDNKGNVKTSHGVSLHVDPKNKNIVNNGGAYRIDSLPKGLKIVQRGNKPEHFEIVPTKAMPLAEYQKLLNQVKVTKA
ncbi:MAG: hypothetical protein FWH04_04400 [Oscillospiraceae bacterium]|nr:hypothetical protein [Oscillospiraceae bacterium]